MQIQSSYSSSFYAAPTKGSKGDSQSSATPAKPQTTPDLEQMLDNLCEDPSIGDRITENDDGTYSFDMRAQGWSEKAFAARAIVLELNGASFSQIEDSSAILPSSSDIALFKTMTGYNILMLGGQQVVLDDEGFPPSAEDQKSVQQAFDFINDVASFRNAGYLEGDLTSDNIGVILSALNITPGSSAFIDQLLEELSTASNDAPNAAVNTEQDKIEELMNLVSV